MVLTFAKQVRSTDIGGNKSVITLLQIYNFTAKQTSLTQKALLNEGIVFEVK